MPRGNLPPAKPHFDIAELLYQPKKNKERLDEIDGISQGLIETLSGSQAKHNLVLKEIEKTQIDNYNVLFSLLTDIPLEYISPMTAWNYLIGKIQYSPPSQILLTDQLSNALRTLSILKQTEVTFEKQYYPYINPDQDNLNPEHPLTQEMVVRKKFRKIIKGFCEGKDSSELILFSDIISPLSITLSSDIIDIYDDHILKSPDLSSDNKYTLKVSVKKKIEAFLSKNNLPDPIKRKTLSIWNMNALRMNRIPPAQRLSYARNIEDISTAELSALITYLNFILPPTDMITDAIAANHISDNAALNNNIHERVQDYLQTMPPLPQSIESLKDMLPEEHTIFKPLFETLIKTIEKINEPSPDGRLPVDPEDPNFKIFHALLQEGVLPDKEALTAQIKKMFSDHIKDQIIPQLTQAKNSWVEDAKKYSPSLENYDLAYQLVINTATTLNRVALDDAIRDNLLGTASIPYLFRYEEDSSLPLYLVRFLGSITYGLPSATGLKLRKAILSIIHYSDNVLLTRAGRSNLRNLGLAHQLPPCLSAAPSLDKIPMDAKLCLLAPTLWQYNTQVSIANFAVTPSSDSPLSFKSGQISRSSAALSHFLSKIMAIPKNMTDKSRLPEISITLCQKTFFSSRGNHFYIELARAYKEEANKLVQENLSKLNPESRNWFAFILNQFPIDVIHHACEELKSAYRKNCNIGKAYFQKTDIFILADEVDSLLHKLSPIIQILSSPAASQFVYKRESIDFWSREERHRHFFFSVQNLINNVKKRIKPSEDLQTGILLPLNILSVAGVEYCKNLHAGLVSALCAPAFTYVTAALRAEPFNPKIEKPRHFRNLLRILFHSPEILSKNPTYQETQNKMLLIWRHRIKTPVEVDNPNNATYLYSRVLRGLTDDVDRSAEQQNRYIPLSQEGTFLNPPFGSDESFLSFLASLFNPNEDVEETDSKDTGAAPPSAFVSAKELEQLLTAQAPLDLHDEFIDPRRTSLLRWDEIEAKEKAEDELMDRYFAEEDEKIGPFENEDTDPFEGMFFDFNERLSGY